MNHSLLHKQLLGWFAAAARTLPFRGTRDPYAIWLSEIMLQQTQVATVIAYYQRFLKKLPTIESLAAAKLDTVLKLWQGLGYYTRAKSLHKAAQFIMQQYGGQFPAQFEQILDLPGIGRYTAGAIASIAFGQRKAVVDGNVIRVLCRLYAIGENPADTKTRDKLWEIAEGLLPKTNCGDWNQALMELGSEICTPTNPQCDACPVRQCCQAFKQNLQAILPIRKKAQKTPCYTVVVGLVIDAQGRILIDKRKAEGFLGGLWELPGGKKQKSETFTVALEREIREETGLTVKIEKKLCTVKHAYSHFSVVLHTYHCAPVSGKARAITCDAVRWISPGHIHKYAFPAGTMKIFAKTRLLGLL